MYYSYSCQQHYDFSFIKKKINNYKYRKNWCNLILFINWKYFIAAFSAHSKSVLIKLFQIMLEHCQGIKRRCCIKKLLENHNLYIKKWQRKDYFERYLIICSYFQSVNNLVNMVVSYMHLFWKTEVKSFMNIGGKHEIRHF